MIIGQACRGAHQCTHETSSATGQWCQKIQSAYHGWDSCNSPWWWLTECQGGLWHCASVTILSFLLLSAHLGLASLYLDFLPFLRNAFHLNTASLLHAVHGSIIPFPYTIYGCPFLFMCNLLRSLLSSIAQPCSLYIHLSSFAKDTAWSVHCVSPYLSRRYILYFPLTLIYLILPCHWISESSHYSWVCAPLWNLRPWTP